MNVTILGCGYVGTAVARYWTQTLGLTVTATTTTPEKIQSLNTVAHHVEVVRGNDPVRLKSILKDQQVVLLSVAAQGRTRDGESYRQAYLETAETLAKILPELPEIKQLIYTGSYAVYGDQDGAKVDETSPAYPGNENNKILLKTEETLFKLANEKLKICVIRLGGIYGKGREIHKIFSRIAGKTRPGDGQYITHWVHLEDIVGVIEFARQHQLDGLYNLVDQSNYTIRELVDSVCEKHNFDPIIWDESQPNQSPYNVKVSNQKLLNAGYQFIHPQTEF
ncbi:MAG: NAD-dependent epimerase/dehydratase family protein [Microcoleaceae cyanobacterium]